ncbi:MAG: protein translocase subunit SecD, partial [Candidatus Paceibacteria bacterium]
INEAIKIIGETPFLEFREERTASETEAILELQKSGDERAKFEDLYFKPTGLTGEYLSGAQVDFEPNTGQPVVNLQFNDEGTKLFSQITERNVGKKLAIYLDGAIISAPVVREAIPSGKAQISGQFTIQEARQLARRLNEGALPVPIHLISQRTVGAILGEEALKQSIRAGIMGFLLISLFMIIYYRLSGLVAVLALSIYTVVVLSIFKLIPVTLTLAGIAGFILSVGMAVDANILIFERTKEELRRKKPIFSALEEGFLRAWPSIRDSNISTIITSIVLYTFATSIIKGFALTLLIGVLVSMFSAILVSRTLLVAFIPSGKNVGKWWFGIRIQDANETDYKQRENITV